MAGLTSLTPVGMAAGLAGGAVQAGLGIYGAIKGAQVAKQAEQDRLAAREEIANTKYADYNQMYYDELQRRANVGLPQEQLMAMQQGADRAAGVGLATSEDRRGGLVGIGRAASGLANAYSQIGLADVAARQQNAQMVLGEMANRGQQTYGEVQQLNQYDLAIAQQRRIEGIQQQQAGLQSITSGVANAGTFLGGTQAAVNPFGTNTSAQPQPQYKINPIFGGYGTDMGSVSINNQPIADVAPNNYSNYAYGIGMGQGIVAPGNK